MIEALSSSETFFFVTLFFLGLVIGSFLNVVIYRLPNILNSRWRQDCIYFLEKTVEKETIAFSLSRPRSHCPACKTLIRAWENIPVFSYIFLKGRCTNCSEKISLRYPIIELLTAILTLYLGYHFGVSRELLPALILSWSLIVLSFIDLDHHLLPDDITLPLLWLGLLVNIYSIFVPLESAVIGAFLGYGILWLIYWIFKLVTGKEGMGFGDFKLLAALGAWLGWESIPTIILLASFAGAAVGISQIAIQKRSKEIPIPFGPYLASAGMLILLSEGQNGFLAIII